MKPLFKPRVEVLENRLAMSATAFGSAADTAPAQPLPVLMVLADRQDFAHQSSYVGSANGGVWKTMNGN